MSSSRIPYFYKLSIEERLVALHERGFLNDADMALLQRGKHTLPVNTADSMIENVVGVFGLPLGLGVNFLINNKDYVVPLCVEEPSIVAGLSSVARLAFDSGGFQSNTTEPLMIGQVQIVNLTNPQDAAKALTAAEAELLVEANSYHPNMVARGGGAQSVEVFQYSAPEDGQEMLVLHLLVNTKEAMGANLVNTMCEGIAGLVETITGGEVLLQILSNLTDRALVTASVTFTMEQLATRQFTGEQVRDRIILANDLALVDPYRATTHNKGIMNGVDAVAIATGNDWRALEAAAHAYAARDGQYRALTRWTKDKEDNLSGSITMPMKVGTVGGSLESNPTVKINHRLLGTPSATELAQVMGAVGLAQNLAALRALSTDGIQKGHMSLHARSVASSAGTGAEYFDSVVAELLNSKDIKVWKAQEIERGLRQDIDAEHTGSAAGKVILFGEHSVVYGHPAIAIPIPHAVKAYASLAATTTTVTIPKWNIKETVEVGNTGSLSPLVTTILSELDLTDKHFSINANPTIPPGMGLGGSASLAVAITRALSALLSLGLTNQRVNAIAFECEKLAHGNPSGLDNTLATYAQIIQFQQNTENKIIEPEQSLQLVVGMTGRASSTSQAVAHIHNLRKNNRQFVDKIFTQISSLATESVVLINNGDWQQLGQHMNLAHGYLNTLELSTPELETLIHTARNAGAMGAKLTGAGMGGSIVALCPDNQEEVVESIQKSGYTAFAVTT